MCFTIADNRFILEADRYLLKTANMKLESVVVFCGSKNGQNPNYVKQTAELGKHIALLNLRMVYGGGKAGLTGVIADSVLANGGKVMGVIPKILTEWESQHTGLTELFVVPDMHT